MNIELLEDVADTNGLIRFSFLTDSIDAEEITNTGLSTFSALSVEPEAEEIVGLTLNTSLSTWLTVEDDEIVDGWFLGNSIPEFDAELAAIDILLTGLNNAATVDNDETIAATEMACLAIDRDDEAATANDLIMFPSELALPKEALAPEGKEQNADLATVAELEDSVMDNVILETRRTGVDADDVSTGDGNPRNCR